MCVCAKLSMLCVCAFLADSYTKAMLWEQHVGSSKD